MQPEVASETAGAAGPEEGWWGSGHVLQGTYVNLVQPLLFRFSVPCSKSTVLLRFSGGA